METEISGRVRNVELVKIIDWIPKVWHHLNRFLEAHSSSDVTIGRQEARPSGGRAGSGRCRARPPQRLSRGPGQDVTLQTRQLDSVLFTQIEKEAEGQSQPQTGRPQTASRTSLAVSLLPLPLPSARDMAQRG